MNWTPEQLQEHYDRLKMQPEVAEESARPQSERLIEAECTKLMEEDGWRALRTDPVSDKSRGKGFGELGMADHLYMRPSRAYGGSLAEVLWVEFKSRHGSVKSHQVEWHTRERARGFRTWIAGRDFPASVEGFREHYATSGLMRRAQWW